MSAEGFWTLTYQGPTGERSGGVVILRDGHISGGDGSFYYKGTYSENDSQVEGSITATHYCGSNQTAFGTNETKFTIQLSGVLDGDNLSGQISSGSLSGKVSGVRRS